jgi:hypothetical protein
MNGLRVYYPSTADGSHADKGIFYSRRSDGPYYQWGYDERTAKWCGVRLTTSQYFVRAVDLASWKSLPAGLRASLKEHYLE